MKIYTVVEYFTHEKYSYYPGEVITPDIIQERGVKPDGLAHFLFRGHLTEAETADAPTAPILPPVIQAAKVTPPPKAE